MIRIIITVFFCLAGSGLKSQTTTDFFPKMLRNDLVLVNGSLTELREMQVSSNMSDEINNGKFFNVSANGASLKCKYVYVGRVKTCRAGGCTIRRDAVAEAESEFFDYYIMFDSSFAVQQVKIYNYQATHGQEVTSKSWLKQFKGFNGEKDLVVNKNVDAISGATISVYAITYDIAHITGLLKELAGK